MTKTGATMFRFSIGFAFLLVPAFVACAPHHDEVRARAAIDLHCSSDDITTSYIGEERYAATGCGKGAVFRCRLDVFDDGTTCTAEESSLRALGVSVNATPVAAAPPVPLANEFSREAARVAVDDARRVALIDCADTMPMRKVPVRIQFGPSGTIEWVEATDDSSGAHAKARVERTLRRAKVTPFRGGAVVVRTSLVLGREAEADAGEPATQSEDAGAPEVTAAE